MQKVNFNLSLAPGVNPANRSSEDDFPIGVFPEQIQKLLLAAEQQEMYKDFLGLSILSATSTAIGNSFDVEEVIKVPAIIWSALIGEASAGKSPAIDLAFQPIEEFEDELYIKYRKKHAEYLTDLQDWKSLPPKERGVWNKPAEPQPEELILNDITSEALIDSLMSNAKSSIYLNDELMGMIKSIKGKMQENLLKLWDNKKWKAKTRARGLEIVDKPFLNLLGGLQPTVLEDFTKGNRDSNGFLYRFLFTMYNEKKLKFVKKIDSELINDYHKIIRKLISINVHISTDKKRQPTTLKFGSNASAIYQEWRSKFKNECVGNAESSIVKKLENYSLRFTLILQLLYWAAGETDRDKIDERAVRGAINLAEYFKGQAFKVQDIIENTKKDSTKSKEILDALLSGKIYKEIAKELRVSEKTIRKVKLQNIDFFQTNN